jgi:transcriptional regulator
MYTPRFNRVTDRSVLLEAMRAYSFAILIGPQGVSQDAGSETSVPIVATHLPLVVKDEGPHGLIEGHFAMANRHWQSLAGRETLVIFPGPHSYVTPKFYVEEQAVPTWNYIAVHAYGTLTLVEYSEEKECLLEGLINTHEPAVFDHWRSMSDNYRRSMLAGIIGFRIPISRIEGKFKISQNRLPEERANVRSAHAAGTDDQRALAAWMERLSG